MIPSLRPLIAAAATLGSAVLLAQTPDTPSWGTTSESSEFVSAWDMQGFEGTTGWTQDATTGNRVLTDLGALKAGLHVPNGAVIDYVELDACDTSATNEATAGIERAAGNTVEFIASVSTGGAAADGCSRWRADLSAPESVDTQTYKYAAFAFSTATDATVSLGALRVYYHLQVSPPPATATFGDVPTNHPFFQFVEALAASGITAGCGGGNFCPDAPLTRGQMAVFLSKALGLNWPVASESN